MWYVRHCADFDKHSKELEQAWQRSEEARKNGNVADPGSEAAQGNAGSGQEDDEGSDDDDDHQSNDLVVFGLFSTTEYQ